MLKITESRNGKNYAVLFLLITVLFFIWGFAHSMLDVLNKHFQESLDISLTQSTLVQNAVYGGYFLMALPAGRMIVRWGYRAGILVGLLVLGAGALMFVPAAIWGGGGLWAFYGMVLALFVIGCGLTCLETSANPYATVLGREECAAERINLAQSLNGLGWIMGPLIGLFLFRSGAESMDVVWPYAVIGVVAWLMAFFFSRVSLPEVEEEENEVGEQESVRLRHSPLFVMGLLSLMLYVAAQTGINSFFINFATSPSVALSARGATLLLSFGAMTLFMLGRLLGAWVMRKCGAEVVLGVCALGAALCMLFMGTAWALPLLLCCYFFESIMFPTIFALSIRGLGAEKKRASAYLIMSIVGGALAPTLMAYVAERWGMMSLSFLIPCVCFVVIGGYALMCRRLARKGI